MKMATTDHEIRSAETQLSISLPQDYRDFLLIENGTEEWFGPVYAYLYSVIELLDSNQPEATREPVPGALYIGSYQDQRIVLDLRVDPAPVLLIHAAAADWSQASPLAASFTAFMSQRTRAE